MGDKRILVVDDVEVVNLGFTRVLRDAGYEVDCACTGEEALKKAGATTYDLVFLDLLLPGMNGVEIYRALRKGLRTMPVVLMSGQIPDEMSAEQKELILELGEDFLLEKPFGEREILSTIKKIFS